MQIKYTKHASDRMSERGISKSDVSHVLAAPLMSMPGHGTAVKYEADTPSGRRVGVVLVKPLDVTKTNVVKTVF